MMTVTSRPKNNRRFANSLAGATFIVVGLLVALVGFPSMASAQTDSLPRAQLVELLSEQYAEKQRAIGLTEEGTVVEIFTTGDGSTWTLVLTAADGTSRVITAGETWIKR